MHCSRKARRAGRGGKPGAVGIALAGGRGPWFEKRALVRDPSPRRASVAQRACDKLLEMTRLAALLAAGSLLACGRALLPQPPVPPAAAERERAEIAACREGTLPPWLGDEALTRSERLEQYEAQAFDPSESYAAGTAGSHAAPLPPPRAADRATGASRSKRLLAERLAFEGWCAARRRGEKLGSR